MNIPPSLKALVGIGGERQRTEGVRGFYGPGPRCDLAPILILEAGTLCHGPEEHKGSWIDTLAGRPLDSRAVSSSALIQCSH